MSGDILAALEAQLEGFCSSDEEEDDSDDDDDDSEDYTSSDDGDDSSSGDEEDSNEDEDDSNEEESSEEDGDDEESAVTSPSQAQQRLQQTRMDASQELQEELERIHNNGTVVGAKATLPPPQQQVPSLLPPHQVQQQQKQSHLINSKSRFQEQLENDDDDDKVEQPTFPPGGTVEQRHKPLPRRQESMDASARLHEVEHSFAKSKEAALLQALPVTPEESGLPAAPTRTRSGQLLHEEFARQQTKEEKARAAMPSSLQDHTQKLATNQYSKHDKKSESTKQQQPSALLRGDDDSLSDVTDSAHDLAMFDDINSSSSRESSSASTLSSATKKNAEELKVSVPYLKQLEERETRKEPFQTMTGASLGEKEDKNDTIDTDDAHKVVAVDDLSSTKNNTDGGPPPLTSMPPISRPTPASRTKLKARSSFKSNHSSTSKGKGNVGALIAGMKVQPLQRNREAQPAVATQKLAPQPLPSGVPQAAQQTIHPEQTKNEVKQPQDKVVVKPVTTKQCAALSSTDALPSFPTDGDSNRSMANTLKSFQLDSDVGHDVDSDSHMSLPLPGNNYLRKPYHHGRGPFGPTKVPRPPAAAAVKEKHRHRPSQSQTIAIVLYVCLGSIVALRLYCLAGYRSLARAKQPHVLFENHARDALMTVSRRMQGIATSLQGITAELEQMAYDTHQPWPLVTFSNLEDLIPDHFETATTSAYSNIIIAPMVTPQRWKKFDRYQQQQQQQEEEEGSSAMRESLLGWDEVYGEPLEPLFVPWQRYSLTLSSKLDDSGDDALGEILQDWYVDNPSYETVWEALTSQAKNKGDSEMNQFLLLQSYQSENNESAISGNDYIIQPLVANRNSGKRGVFRSNHAERSVVAVVAVQVRLSVLVAEALRESFSFLKANAISVVAQLEDPCLGSKAAYKISAAPLFASTSITAGAPTSRNVHQGVSEVTNLVENSLLHGESDYGDKAGFSHCLHGSSGLELYLRPTATLLVALRSSPDWNYLRIVVTWLLLYTFVAYAVYFGNLENNRVRQMGDEQREKARALEEIDPFDAFSSATMAVMEIAGWDDWVNAAGRAPSEVQSFLTSLLHAMDGVATKHGVVKIQMVGSSLVYGVGGKDHALCVADFVRECYARMGRWMDHFARTYGSKTRDLQFLCGFDSGSLMDGDVMANMSTSQVSGSAIRTATRLATICENGRVLISKNSANMLRKLKRGDWVLSRDAITVGEELFWLDASKESYKKQMTSSNRNASARLKDSKHNSRKSLLSVGTDGKAYSTTNSRSSLRSGGTLSRGRSSVNSIHSLFDDAESLPQSARLQKRNSQDSPPPLKGMEERPPIAQINVQAEMEGVPSAPDLGYESIEPKTFEQEERSDSGSLENKEIEMEEKRERLIEWSVDVLTRCLEEVLAARTTSHSKKALAGLEDQLGKGSNILEQCKECIAIPIFSKSELRERAQPGSVKLTNAGAMQLRDYVTKIANHYHDETNIFHSFEHAANVTASMRKLFNKLAGNDFGKRRGSEKSISGLKSMKDNSGRSLFSSISVGENNSFGITTDPLIKFSILFCALIHDVDHPGISNATLVAQKSPMAAVYKQRSVAEQNSVDFSWTLLMRPEYVDLRAAIYCDERELQRFRQVIVNCVLATDLDDAELQMVRKARWAKAFSDDTAALETAQKRRKKPMRRHNKSTGGVTRQGRMQPEPTASGGGMLAALRQAASEASKGFMTRPKANRNRKGTIVLEHLLQAANISHCMQNWKVYLKWNERLFDENYEAYEADRIIEDPAADWYQGELDFFDTTVIPLAKKLVSCGILGDTAEELLENAFLNRDEWEAQGHEIMKIYLAHYQEAHINQLRLSQSDLQIADTAAAAAAAAGVELSDVVVSLSRFNTNTSDVEKIGAPGAPNKKITLQAAQPVNRIEEPKVAIAQQAVTTDSKHVQTMMAEETTKGSEGAPLLIPGTANSSVTGTISNDGTGSGTGDPDVVFAILDNADAPDDFDSYILVTPKQKRQREAKLVENEGENPIGRRRRALRTRSTSSGVPVPVNAFRRSHTSGSVHSRKSFTDSLAELVGPDD